MQEVAMHQLPMHETFTPLAQDISFLASDETVEHSHPFFADGFAGLIYSRSGQPFRLQPGDKELSDFYLYGQTVHPISLDVSGPFRLVVIRLYPFAIRMLLNVDPRDLKDECYDLRLVDGVDTDSTLLRLHRTESTDEVVDILAQYFAQLLRHAASNPDYRVRLATNLILKASGQISIKEVREALGVSERTLERNFHQEIGVTPKQFARIVQFRSAMTAMTDADYLKLTDVGYESGYSDQSHFIRSFKDYTGRTPRQFLEILPRA